MDGDTNCWSANNDLNRMEEKVIARLRTGHTKQTHNYVFERTDPRPPPLKLQRLPGPTHQYPYVY